MEISKEQRHDVAAKMRQYDVAEFEESAIVPFLECLGCGYKDWRGILDHLADLIDRPTTSIDVNKHGRAYCINCGCDDWCLADGDAHFCPKCGMEIYDED